MIIGTRRLRRLVCVGGQASRIGHVSRSRNLTFSDLISVRLRERLIKCHFSGAQCMYSSSVNDVELEFGLIHIRHRVNVVEITAGFTLLWHQKKMHHS